MAVGFFDKSSAPSSASAVTSHDHNNMVAGGANGALFALLCLSGDSAANPTAVWDAGGTNQTMQLAASRSTAGALNAYIFCRVAPTSSVGPLSFAWSGSRDVIAAAVNFTGVSQVSPYSGVNSAAGTGTAASVALNAGADDANVALFAGAAAIDSVNGNEIFRTFTSLSGAGNWQPGNIASMDATLNSSGNWAAAGLVVEVFVPGEDTTIITGSLTTNTTFTAILRRTQFVST
jgi:hypothetical protein